MFDGHDTAVSEKTWEASLLAAGAVIEACDAVMKEGFRNAFCAVRPPGHHAGIFGKTVMIRKIRRVPMAFVL